jgi:hypothetical protein
MRGVGWEWLQKRSEMLLGGDVPSSADFLAGTRDGGGTMGRQIHGVPIQRTSEQLVSIILYRYQVTKILFLMARSRNLIMRLTINM